MQSARIAGDKTFTGCMRMTTWYPPAAARPGSCRPCGSGDARGVATKIDHIALAYANAAMPARIALERGAWKEAAKLALDPAADAYPWKKYPQAEAVNAFARGVGAAMNGTPRLPRSRSNGSGRSVTPRPSGRSATGPSRSTSRPRWCAAWPAAPLASPTRAWRSCGPPPTARTPPRSTSSRRVCSCLPARSLPWFFSRTGRPPRRCEGSSRCSPRSRTATAPLRAPCRRPSARGHEEGGVFASAWSTTSAADSSLPEIAQARRVLGK